jgi:fumarate reductase subunit C
MTFDWFKLAPKAMPVQLGEKKASDRSIVVAHYVVWALLTAFVAWLVGVIP